MALPVLKKKVSAPAAAAVANKGPAVVKKGLPIGKAKAPVKAVEVEEEEEEEQEEEAAPAKPVKKGLVAKAKAAPVEEAEEEEEEEAAEEEEETEEEEEASEEEESAEEETEEEEEEETPAPAPKKGKTVVPAKKTVAAPVAKAKAGVVAKKATVKKAEEETAPAAGKRGLFGGTSKKAVERKVPVEGGVITREELLRRFSEKNGLTIADSKKALELFEQFLTEDIFPNYSVNLFGVKFKRSVVADRLYDGVGGLAVETDGLVTLVKSHVSVKANITVGKESLKGAVTEEGEFVEGKYIKDVFVAGSYVANDEGTLVFKRAK